MFNPFSKRSPEAPVSKSAEAEAGKTKESVSDQATPDPMSAETAHIPVVSKEPDQGGQRDQLEALVESDSGMGMAVREALKQIADDHPELRRTVSSSVGEEIRQERGIEINGRVYSLEHFNDKAAAHLDLVAKRMKEVYGPNVFK